MLRKMKGFKSACVVAALCVVTLALSACTTSGDVGKTGTLEGTGYSIDGYACLLEHLVAMPEYDTDTQKGYGVVFLQKEAEPPIVPDSPAASAGFSRLTTRIDMTLMEKGEAISSTDVLFQTTDDKKFEGRVTIVFRIDNDKSFPQYGTLALIEVDKDGHSQTKLYDMNFQGMEVIEPAAQ